MQLLEQVPIYYRSDTVAGCCIDAWVDTFSLLTRWRNFYAWNDLLSPSWKCDVRSKIWLHTLHTFLKNVLAKFHPSLIEM